MGNEENSSRMPIFRDMFKDVILLREAFDYSIWQEKWLKLRIRQ